MTQILLGIITTIPLVSASPFYAFTILDTLGGNHGGAYGINNRGQIVGWSHTSDNATHATLWDDTIPTSLAMLSTTNASIAFDINDSGQVAGVSFNANLGGNNRATLWEGVNVTDLGKDNGFSVAYGINNLGQIVGTSDFPDVTGIYAALWEYVFVTDLSSLGGNHNQANAINNKGQIVGRSSLTNSLLDGYHATLWSDSITTDLGSFSGASQASDINDKGQIVGSSNFASSIVATLWDGATLVDLGTLGGDSWANAINNNGQIVGESYLAESIELRATLWNNFTIIDLNSFLDPSIVSAGWVLRSANDINNHGWIAGTAENTITGYRSAYLLSVNAIPEPTILYLLIIGIVGFRFNPRNSPRTRQMKI